MKWISLSLQPEEKSSNYRFLKILLILEKVWAKQISQLADLIFLGSKSMWMVTTAMKLKYACSLEEKIWHT